MSGTHPHLSFVARPCHCLTSQSGPGFGENRPSNGTGVCCSFRKDRIRGQCSTLPKGSVFVRETRGAALHHAVQDGTGQKSERQGLIQESELPQTRGPSLREKWQETGSHWGVRGAPNQSPESERKMVRDMVSPRG